MLRVPIIKSNCGLSGFSGCTFILIFVFLPVLPKWEGNFPWPISTPLSLHIVVPFFLMEVLPFSVCFILKPSPSPQLSSVTQQALGFSLIPCYLKPSTGEPGWWMCLPPKGPSAVKVGTGGVSPAQVGGRDCPK